MENASKALVIAGAILISILLITIGIVLVNSGKGVAETGTANMNSQKIQAFNSQFTPYEGKKKGAEIRSLVNLVNASNATDEEHQVTLRAAVAQGNYEINSSKNYEVSIEYYSGSKTVPGPALGTAGWKVFAGPSSNNSIKSENGYIYYIEILEL